MVDVNDASPWQLAVLLDLNPAEVRSLLLARPFGSVEALHATLPRDKVAKVAGLQLRRRDLNAATADEVVGLTGVPRPVVEQVLTNRPYYFLSQLRALVGESTAQAIESLFDIPRLAFTDKLTGHRVTLRADSSRVLLSRSESESFSDTADTLGLRPVFRSTGAGLYEVLDVPQTESTVDVLSRLQVSYGRNVLPSYRDEQSSRRYLNPRFCSVQFRDGFGEDVQQAVLAECNVLVQERHRSPGLYTVEVPAARRNPVALATAIDALNAHAQVRFAEPNYLSFDDFDVATVSQSVAGATPDGEAVVALPWNLSMVGLPAAWSKGRGSPDVIIAVIDSGIDVTHPALRDAILVPAADESWNFVDEEPGVPDDQGHGTFIAGVLVGNGTDGVQGVCPDCRILPLKVPLRGEVNSYARRRDAILYAVDRVNAGRRLVLNLSWKTTGDVGLIRDAVAIAASKGAIVVASAGNLPERENEPHYPSDYKSVISVAAVGPTGRRASYSFWGDEVDLSAPGGEEGAAADGIRSAAPGGGVRAATGTSFAAPHVAGVAALLTGFDRTLSGAEIRDILEFTARPLQDPGMGRGSCDAGAAAARLTSVGAGTDDGRLAKLNTASQAELVARYGLLPFTARVLVARRPFTGIDDVRGVLGLSSEQFAAISTDVQAGD